MELLQRGVFIAQRGFTLVEIIVVMILIGILGALAVPSYIDLESNAKQKAIIAGIAELNGRERMVWANEKSSARGYIDDDTIFSLIDTNLGADYTWKDLPTANGGSLRFKGSPPIALRRTSSVFSQPVFWNIYIEPPPSEPPPDDEGDSGDAGGGSWWDRWSWWRR